MGVGRRERQVQIGAVGLGVGVGVGLGVGLGVGIGEKYGSSNRWFVDVGDVFIRLELLNKYRLRVVITLESKVAVLVSVPMEVRLLV